MDYYAAVSQILPVLYLAIIVEYRWLRVESKAPGPEAPLLPQVVYAAKWFLVWISAITFTLAEGSVLQGLKDGVTKESTDRTVFVTFAIAVVLLVYPLALPGALAKVQGKAWLIGTAAGLLVFFAFRWIVLSIW